MTDLNTITRFDLYTRPATDDADEREVVRFFHKRKLIGEFDTDDCSRYPEGFDEQDFAEWLTEGARTLTEAMDYISAEPDEDGEFDDEDGREPGSIVPEHYRIIYGAAQNCGDDVAQILTDHVTTDRANKKNPDGGLDRAKLRAVAEINGIGDKLAEWEDRGLNGGLLRMNTSNVLRGMVRRGEQVIIGEKVWEADPSKMEARIAKRKAARKAKKGA